MTACTTCGTDLPQKTGPGRPNAYCTEGCRRVNEFRIRALVRRIERYALEQREIKARFRDDLDDDERTRRLRALRRWLREDEAKLRELLGANMEEGRA